MRYELVIYWSKADGAFVVEVPELAGCMADGATYEEAVANPQVVIAEWVETAKSLGRPIPGAAREAGFCVSEAELPAPKF